MRINRHVIQHAAGKGKPCVGPMEVFSPCNPMPNELPPAACGRGLPQNCIFSDWETSLCNKQCGGGLKHTARHIVTPAKDGGVGCNGTARSVESCNMQACVGGTDCTWFDWRPWSACTRCGGQRTRTRGFRPAGPGGANCHQGHAEEIEGCSRHCHGEHFCAWQEWDQWSACSVRCGFGRVSRTRSLALSSLQPRPPLQTQAYLNTQSKYEALTLEMNARRGTHNQAIAVAFVGGCISFMTLAAAFRLCTRKRPSEEGYYLQVESEAPVDE